MRSTRTIQPSVFQAPEVVHPVAEELERASTWLDQHLELLETVLGCVGGSAGCGRHGLTCETILRCAVLKHLMGYSYLVPGVGVRAARFGHHAALRAGRSARGCRRNRRCMPASRRSTPRPGEASTACCCRTPSCGGRVGQSGAHRLHGDRHRHTGTLGQPPVVRQRAGADAVAATGAATLGGGVALRPLPRCQATRAGDPLGAWRAAAGGHLPAAAEAGGSDDRLRGGGAGSGVLRN